MKNIFKKSLFLSVVLITISGSSCKKNYLEQLPETGRTINQVYKTSADFYTAVVGAYSTFKHTGLYGTAGGGPSGVPSALLNLGEVVSDNADFGATRAVSNAATFELEDFNFSLSNTFFSSAWTGNYLGIGRVNTILARLPDASFDAALKTRFEAESKFLRAFFYFNLVRQYGDVQLKTTETTGVTEGYDIPRSPSTEIYKLIISDLMFAENNLPPTIPASEAGRASSWAAKALLGKVYLYQKEYLKASQKLNEVIVSNQFNVSANTYAAVFSNTTAYTANKDVILAVQYKGGNIGQGSSIWSATTPFNGGSSSVFGITNGGGEGFMRPTTDIIAEYEPGDLRKAASVATSYVNNSGATVNERYLVKYRQTGTLANEADIDFPIIRYADVLLMYAEALVEQNPTGIALAFAPSASNGPVNLVRKRAGLADILPATQDDARLAIEHERRVELAFEGHRWFDLVRTGRYLPVMVAKNYPTKDFHKLFPVPQRETDLNPGLKPNNTGYN